MPYYVIRNDLHNTSARVRVGTDGRMSAAQVTRVRRELCGVAGCECCGALGDRGPQDVVVVEVGYEAGQLIATIRPRGRPTPGGTDDARPEA